MQLCPWGGTWSEDVVEDLGRKMDGWLRAAGMMGEGSRVGVVCVGHRSFAGPQDDNLVSPTTCGDDGAEKMDPR
jgi:hypothetical protein